MKTYYVRSSEFILKIGIFLLLILTSFTAEAQVNEEEEEMPTDTIGYNTGRVELNNPPSVVEAYTYDPVTDRYIYTNSVGGFNINYPVILTPKEYEELLLRESIRTYFRQKADAIDGKKEGSEADKKDLLPRYYVNSSFFETVFGSNTIDVKPTGYVEMDLGIRYTKQDNPAISPRNRSALTFDFDQRIGLSLMGMVGTRLKVTANYDTESSFAFQNMIKLEYTPTEDDIIQKIEVGNVSLPLNSTLIKGAQSLFGVKLQLQFGKTTVTGIFSEQKSQTKAVVAQGGGTIQEFDLFALDYDSDRHFFLGQYFRNRYDASLVNYPLIDSRVQITRIEVWVTNKQNRVSQTDNNLRNIVALQDLGESQQPGQVDNEVVILDPIPPGFFLEPPGTPSDNGNNQYDPFLIDNPNAPDGLLNNSIREISTVNSGFPAGTVDEGQDYSKLENARKLTANEFTYHPQLGYISLQQRLANDEVLAVAYQYTIGDKVYQVGEFANGGVESTEVIGTDPATQEVNTKSLILKMLKSNLTTVENNVGGVRYTTPVWNLMMKNIYQIAPGGQLEQEDFRFNILYSDPSPLNYITPAGSPPLQLPEGVAETPLLQVFNVDRLNFTNDPGKDGFFDFIPGLTVDSQNGRIIFTTVEPFGKHLFEKLRTSSAENYNGDATSSIDYNDNQEKYVFRSMYRSTQARALQDSEKNKYELRGKYKSTAGDGIAIGAYNVPRGSVVVTANGRVLVEGLDYSVNYQLGRVQILDPSLQAANTPIQISVENNSVFGQQTRRFMGINVEHKFSDKFQVGATFLKMTERPFTQKSNYGQESVNNSIFGANLNYGTEVPFLTRLVNKLPNIDTDVPSNISFRGEVAFLKPDAPKADQFQGEATIYIDDFEGSQTTIDMKSPLAWSLSSVPTNKEEATNPDFDGNEGDEIETGYKRAKLSWYTVDPIFYTSQRPGSLTDQDLGTNKTRRVYIRELFPQTDIADGQQTVINTLDLTYYPSERGPYNFSNLAGGTNILPNPTENFGGIMRSLSSTNFEQSNVEYIQFWIMDPYFNSDPDPENPTNTGKIYFNLGEISEDVLSDRQKQYENGLPEAGSVQNTNTSEWGRIPMSQSLIYAFDTSEANRAVQDVGLDGLDDAGEAAKFPDFAGLADPSADNYRFYLSQEGSVLERYKDYNNLQGNSPVSVSDNNRGNTTIPDVEDINRDNTMNTIDGYYQYSIDLVPNMAVGANYITDERITTGSIPGPANQSIPVRWLQFKVPLDQPGREKVGPIEDFRSIRFMRMYMTGFSEEITVRFGTLDLVRGEWRRFANTLDPEDTDIDDDNTNFDVQSVNIQENSNRTPIKYVTPPGVVREQLYNNNTIINQNEQSLALRITGTNPSGLEPGDSRAVFKNVSVDMRQFNKLRMFLHAESLVDDLNPERLQDNEMAAFLRFGNDFTQNYYQVELPLQTTKWLDSNTEAKVWPEENEIDLRMSLLTKLKIMAMGDPGGVDEYGVYSKFEDELDPSLADKPNKLRLSIKGNPNFGQVRTLMVGVKNNTEDGRAPDGAPLTERPVQGEVWFNELRMSGMDNKGGMAAVASFDGNLADFATVSATGRMSTIGFGSLEDGPNERSREDIRQYNFVSNLNLGKLLPKKWYINLPFNYGVGEEIITPEYDPFNQDIKLDQLISVTQSQAEKDNIRERAIEYTKTKSINFIGVKKERAPEQKPHVYDPENLTLSYSFNETEKHDYEIEEYVDQQLRTSVDYSYNFQPKPIEPLKKNKFLKKSSYWKILSDFNFNYLPSNINFSSTILRQYNRQQFRQVDVVGIKLDELYRRNYLFNYQYGFNYNLTKALKVNFTAASSNIVRSYLDDEGEPTIWDDYLNFGEANQHTQQLTVNYELPINKLPFLSFVKSTYTYTGDYQWQRASEAFSQVISDGQPYDLGNTIQNNSSHRLNTALNLDLFYKYIGLTKAPKSTKRPVTPTGPPKPGEKISNPKAVPQANASPVMDALKGILTSVKNIQVNYTETSGMVLPGYLPDIGFFGTSKPTLGFVFGMQDDVRDHSAENGWLTKYPGFNQSFTMVTAKTLDMTANIDLFPDFKIDLTGNRTYMNNFSEQYDIGLNMLSGEYEYNHRSPYNFGNFSISTILIKTAFSQSDENSSEAFDKFRENRLVIADRLAIERGIDLSAPGARDDEGFPKGFGKNSQRVLLPAFLAAYTGTDASGTSMDAFKSFPLPNWNIKYTGLMRLQFFKDKFKRFSIQHGYKANYTVNSFRSNFDYFSKEAGPDKGWDGRDAAENFLNPLLISNINLVEQFSPLVKFDMEMKNSVKVMAEMKKDRAMSLSFDNNLLTEVQGLEYIVGLGYRIKDVIFNSALADNPTGVIRSDINLKADLSLRNTKTIVRYLDYDNNQLGGGQNLWSLKLYADYAFSKNLTASFYYDHSFSKAVISTAFPITNIRSGFTLKYNFGN